VQTAVQAFPLAGPVYEFGSYLVEEQGSLANLRSLFPGRQYVGCDMRHGPGVDRIEDLEQLTLPDESIQTIVCVDTLEHVFDPPRAVSEMLRVLAPGGVILISVPMDFRVHDYPSDYWRLTPSCVSRLLAPLEASIVGWQGVENYPHTVLGIGCKGPVNADFMAGINRFTDLYQAWLDRAAAAIPWQKKLKQKLVGWTRGKGERRRDREYHQARFAIQMPLAQDWKQELFSMSTSPAKTGTRIDL
jgi:SAM-dependent methyltransferase